MDGAPLIPSTLTSEFDNMHISDKDKDSEKVDDEESLLNARRRIQYEKIRSGICHPCIRGEMMREECEKIKDRYMSDPKFREECEAKWRKEEEEFFLPGEKEALIKFWYGESSDDSDLDGEDRDDLDLVGEDLDDSDLDDGK